MAGTQTNISIDYDSQAVTTVLDRLIANVSDTQPAMIEIAEYLHERTRDHFDNQQDPDGTPWAPLAPSTLKAKQRKGVPVDKILHGQHLHLRDTIFPFWSNNEAGVSTGPGTEAYAATQQFGADERSIEARPFLGVNAEDETEVIEIMNQFLTGGL
ncbi:phage virion morphogenesis protein [Neptunomonas japonica]|uniref:phage virion morphogenesis protein n=1 Tax=Neptunomonas japonica TaxID=417574 RepID=UPI0004291E4A|nr:phage virion morphogenesis protein [Neptunomonas japonica]